MADSVLDSADNRTTDSADLRSARAIWDAFVKNDKDLVGVLAFSLYQKNMQEKEQRIGRLLTRDERPPTKDEVDAYIHSATDILVKFGSELALAQLERADPKDVKTIALSQIRLLENYHKIAQGQAERSFAAAAVVSSVGFAFFLLAAGLVVWKNSFQTAVVPALSGSITEAIAATVFVLYGNASKQLENFHKSLEKIQRYLLANSLCENLDGAYRQKALSNLISEMVRERPIPRENREPSIKTQR